MISLKHFLRSFRSAAEDMSVSDSSELPLTTDKETKRLGAMKKRQKSAEANKAFKAVADANKPPPSQALSLEAEVPPMRILRKNVQKGYADAEEGATAGAIREPVSSRCVLAEARLPTGVKHRHQNT